jgi:hypothetical protein
MISKTVPLYSRLPEIYRIRDGELSPPDQFKSYLAHFESVFGAVHANIEQLYRDLFIETCDPWVIPYIGGLLGTSVLSGDSWTLRADVADTIRLRRRKGTIGAIEQLAFDLTKWGAHVVELRENLTWHQHLNHLRPDAGGVPPLSLPGVTRNTMIRGGTVSVRDPAMLSFLGTPFDPYAYYADVRPPDGGAIRINLPNLAIFLWRLSAYRPPVTKPVFRGNGINAAPNPGDASIAIRFDVHPLSHPVRLFNTPRYDPDRQPPVVTQVDETPGPIPPARLSSDDEAGNPGAYVTVGTYTPGNPLLGDLEISDAGLQFHVPSPDFTGNTWTFRGANLCAWETPLRPPLRDREIAIDPVIGRVVLGVATGPEATAIQQDLLITYTYGATGPVGSHPVSRPAPPTTWNNEVVQLKTVRVRQNPNGLRDALANIQNSILPVVVEIDDSFVHDLDLSTVPGIAVEGGQPNLRLNRTLIIRATSGNRPIVRLAQPFRFRPLNVVGATPPQQAQFDGVIANMLVRLEGLYLTRSAAFPAGQPLIARAALNRLEITGCTLEPDGHLQLDGTRAPINSSLDLRTGYSFVVPAELTAFKETPEVILDRSITGPLLVDRPYVLTLRESILDAGKGIDADSTSAFALSSATDPVNDWGPPTQISQGLTVFGRMRVESANGRGGIWVHKLEVLNNQKGCIKFSYFSGEGDRLPQNFACVRGPAVRLSFSGEIFGQPSYAQLARSADFLIRERGPDDDQMGAFGFLLEVHRWRNLQIRIREFMPVGVRPLLVAVT